ncbi:hypothetical protein IWW34DRAFT_4892 [Fusarium oxysporum f. sp. albedinis]|nr:hypothetical protein FOMA001_g5533 [Fusarium oxysporum f. sp. matthiolae]KAI3587523.1 hypothetical protein IWW34DRAFT_4892 [Fusarium oxysporum f. sp. albedinis]KAJ0156727.1 ATP-dependent Clp protease proteolytic subunit [Fusarium oxysporum f. sp. albedinis]KAK2483993.1 hypothetical protein H9L39_05785 [Fusarium oxysporum f. sp. albedinis]
MPTQEVLNQWEASSPTTKSEGPLQGTSNRSSPSRIIFILQLTSPDQAPQSLVSKQECFAAQPNAEVCPTYDDGRLALDQDRVRNSGARTPGSIHADIVAQIEAKRERKASEEAKKDKKKST